MWRSASGRNPAFVNTHLESVNRNRGKKKKTPNASDSSQGSKTNVPVYRNLEKLRHPVPAWRRSSDDNQNSGVGRSRKRSVILGPDRKSTTSHLDVRAVWRLLLTGTKGLQSLGVAKLTEPGALFTMQLSFSASPLPSLSLSLSLLCLRSVLFPHFNNSCSANRGLRRGRGKITPYYQICSGGERGARFYDSLRGNIRWWAALHLCASPGMERQGRLARGNGVWSETIRFQNEPATVYSQAKLTVKKKKKQKKVGKKILA